MIELTRTTSSAIPLEVFGLVPKALHGKSPDDIARLPILYGNRKETVGDHFQVRGQSSDNALSFKGNCHTMKGIGAGMGEGTIHVHGDAGWHTGAQMTGGMLTIDGNVADWLGAEMAGGKIVVNGHAGNQVGAAYRGSRRGMRGGMITIAGNAGDELGLLLRRGLIAVAGNTGEFTGASLIAGTILVAGNVGGRVGAGMKRGTIIVNGDEPAWSPGFDFACEYRPSFLGVLQKEWLKDFSWANRVNGPVRLYRGDRVNGGKGEVWHVTSTSS